MKGGRLKVPQKDSILAEFKMVADAAAMPHLASPVCFLRVFSILTSWSNVIQQMRELFFDPTKLRCSSLLFALIQLRDTYRVTGSYGNSGNNCHSTNNSTQDRAYDKEGSCALLLSPPAICVLFHFSRPPRTTDDARP